MFQYSSLYFWLGLLLSIITLGLAKKQKDTRRLSSRFIVSKLQDMHYVKDKHIIIVVRLFLSLLDGLTSKVGMHAWCSRGCYANRRICIAPGPVGGTRTCLQARLHNDGGGRRSMACARSGLYAAQPPYPSPARYACIIKKLRINLSTAHSSRIRPWPLQHVCGNSASYRYKLSYARGAVVGLNG